MFKFPGFFSDSGAIETGLIRWRDIQSKLQWGVIVQVGGGFAMAEGAKRACLSHWLSSRLAVLGALGGGANSLGLQVSIAAVTTVLTEFMSNAAASSVIQPILAQLALGVGINPLYLMIPAAYGTYCEKRF